MFLKKETSATVVADVSFFSLLLIVWLLTPCSLFPPYHSFFFHLRARSPRALRTPTSSKVVCAASRHCCQTQAWSRLAHGSQHPHYPCMSSAECLRGAEWVGPVRDSPLSQWWLHTAKTVASASHFQLLTMAKMFCIWTPKRSTSIAI